MLLKINGYIEITAGVLLLILPFLSVSFPGMEIITEPGPMFPTMYGAAAMSLGALSLALGSSILNTSVTKRVHFIFAIFHTLLAINQFYFNPMIAVGILHGGLAIAFWVSLIRK